MCKIYMNKVITLLSKEKNFNKTFSETIINKCRLVLP